jgi:hypothetical protein
VIRIYKKEGLKMNTKKAETISQSQRRSLEQISHQIEIAMASDETPQGVKDCLYSIIFEASNEAGLPLGDMSLVRAAFPNIIENLNYDYGRGVYHSIHTILIHNTTAFQKFFDDKLDQDAEDLANLLSRAMKHPQMPTKLYNVLGEHLIEIPGDADSPEWILANLKKWSLENEK